MAIRLFVILCFLLSPAVAGTAIGSEWSPATGNDESQAELTPELPLPFGISFVHVHVTDRTRLGNYRPVTMAGLPGEATGGITFDRSESRTDVYNLRTDMWLLPFLNVYMLGGYMEGESSTIINFNDPSSGQTATLTNKEVYYGTNIGGGMTLAYLIDRLALSLDMSYTRSNLNVVESDIKSITIGPRLGYRSRLGNIPVTISVGGVYQNIKQTLTISESAPGSGQPLVAKLDIEGDKRWNTVITGTFDFGKQWHVVTEFGFDDRKSLVAQLTYRFE